jgi:hypothetical protein
MPSHRFNIAAKFGGSLALASRWMSECQNTSGWSSRAKSKFGSRCVEVQNAPSWRLVNQFSTRGRRGRIAGERQSEVDHVPIRTHSHPH